MAMNPTTFTLGMRTVSAVLPYGKKLLDDEIKFIWLMLPEGVKDLVTDQMWGYACSQRLMDPNPDKELALHIQLLRYLYRIRDGQPAFDWGLKADLPQRMAMGGQFHPPVLPAGDPTPPPPQLPGSNPALEGLF